jgi:glycosyltransferase involved in cell wall biosynthesis
MNPRTEISVVIPVYNSENYIEPTLDSVGRQTVLPLEVLVIDDGSTDRTCDLVDAYGVAHPDLRIRLIRSPHAGPGEARNRGIEGAKGAWIAFLDSDDLWFSEKLEQVARCCDAFPDANFFCHNELHRHLDGTETLLDYAVGFCATDSLSRQLYWRNRFSTSAVVCSRHLLIEVGLFDTSLPSAQDYELWLRMSPMIRVQFIRQTLGIYVDRSGNITSMSRWRRYRNVLRVLNRHRSMVDLFMYVKTVSRLSASYGYNWVIRSPINRIRQQFMSLEVKR